MCDIPKEDSCRAAEAEKLRQREKKGEAEEEDDAFVAKLVSKWLDQIRLISPTFADSDREILASLNLSGSNSDRRRTQQCFDAWREKVEVSQFD